MAHYHRDTQTAIDACPNCGKSHRLKTYQPTPRSAPFGNRAYVVCFACKARTPIDSADLPEQYIPDGPTRAAIYALYTEVAQHCHALLYSDAGRAALAYLHKRGLTDATIQELKLGYSPSRYLHNSVESLINGRDSETRRLANAAGLVVLRGPSMERAQQWTMLDNSIIIPYIYGRGSSEVVYLRARKLDTHATTKYLSPFGVAFAGGPRALYGSNVLHAVQDGNRRVILTEGELKAAAALQAWRAGAIDRPAVAIPGIDMLHADNIKQLVNCEVTILLDSEQRKDPFEFSPSERATITNGYKLTGSDLRGRVYALEQKIKKDKDLDEESTTAAELELNQLKEQLEAIEALNISVKVARLPRKADVAKVDLDEYVLDQGAPALQSVLSTAVPWRDWLERRGHGDYQYKRGYIMTKQGQKLANYQAIVTEDHTIDNGSDTISAHKIAILTPSGQRTSTVIPADVWADNRKGLQALRAAIGEGSADDDGTDALRAIKQLSQRGDGPTRRTIYTATGWQMLGDRWAYLAPDGAITATGRDTSVSAEIEHATGNHYALCGAGDAQQGAQAFLALLRGAVCGQSLGLLLASTAALPLMHRFTRYTDRPMLWLYGESGSAKTSLARAVAALYGPGFTGKRGGGGALIKWDSTAVGLEQHAFTYRDVLTLIDDYKGATADNKGLARFLHNYSEGTSRTRGTISGRGVTTDKGYVARCIAIATGEDRPIADPGILARLTLCPVAKNTVNLDALEHLQAAGERGDLAAFWRGFVQWLAARLDTLGMAQFRAWLHARIDQDDQALSAHQRTQASLRQQRIAFLLLTDWLVDAQCITDQERAQLCAAHLDTRALIATEQAATQHDERPSTILTRFLMEGVASGELLIDTHEPSSEYINRADSVIGFHYQGAVALYADKVYRLFQVARRNSGAAVNYSSKAIQDQLKADGLIARHNKGLNTYQIKRNGATLRYLVVTHGAIFGTQDTVAHVALAEHEPQPTATTFAPCPDAVLLDTVAQVAQVAGITDSPSISEPTPEQTMLLGGSEGTQKIVDTLSENHVLPATEHDLYDCDASKQGSTCSATDVLPATVAPETEVKAIPSPHVRAAYNKQVRIVRMLLAPSDPRYDQADGMPIEELRALEQRLRAQQGVQAG